MVGVGIFMLVGVAACGGEEEASAGDEAALASEDFTNFNADDNEVLSQDEFNSGIYENYDTDGSGTLDEEEFNTLAGSLYGDYEGSFSDLDTDGNGELSQEEFDQSIEDTGLYEEYDADGNSEISQEEFNQSI